MLQKDYKGRLPLHYAAIHGHLLCVKHLLSLGTPVDVTDNDGNTPLGYAVNHMKKSGTVALLEAGKRNLFFSSSGANFHLPFKTINKQKAARQAKGYLKKIFRNSESKASESIDSVFSIACKQGERGLIRMMIDSGRLDFLGWIL